MSVHYSTAFFINEAELSLKPTMNSVSTLTKVEVLYLKTMSGLQSVPLIPLHMENLIFSHHFFSKFSEKVEHFLRSPFIMTILPMIKLKSSLSFFCCCWNGLGEK